MKKTPATPKRPARRTHTPPTADNTSGSMSAGKTGVGKKANAIAKTNAIASGDENEGGGSQAESLIKPININASVLRRCKQHAKELGIKTLKEYSESALLYFVKNGIDPTQKVGSGEVSTEVVKLRNQVFSFCKSRSRPTFCPCSERSPARERGQRRWNSHWKR